MENDAKGRVLVIDSDIANSRMIADVLLGIGYDVDLAQNDAVALTRARAYKYDLFVVDYDLQGSTWFELVQHLAEIGSGHAAPILVTLSAQVKSDLARVLESGAADVIIKPFSRSELIARASPHLEIGMLHRNLRLFEEKQQHSSLSNEEFLIKLSHQIRTLINGISNALELLNDSALTKQQKEYASFISKSSDSMLKLIKDVIDFSLMEAKKLSLESESFDIRKKLDDVVAMHSTSALSKVLNLSIEFDDKAPRLVYGDPDRLAHVLDNLMANAIKFTERGDVCLKVSVLKAHEDQKIKLLFEVIDSGAGISEEGVKLLFKTFSNAKAHENTKANASGGLGLIISKRLVELMGGEMGVRSRLGEGSTFWFSLLFETPKHTQTESTLPVGEPQKKDIASLNILLVEDNPINNRVARYALQKLGHTVVSVENGMEAVERFVPNEFNAIIMDVSMPVMSGLDATRHIRELEASIKDPDYKPVRIIAMTANVIRGDREMCLSSGMDEYISKPFRFEELIRVLQ